MKNNLLAFDKFTAAIRDAIIAYDKTGDHKHDGAPVPGDCVRCNIIPYLPERMAHQIRQARLNDGQALRELTAMSYRALAECAGMAAHCSTPDTCLPQGIGDPLVEHGYLIKTEERESGPHWYAITESGCNALARYKREGV